MLKRLSITRSIVAAVVFGILIPIVVWRFTAVDEFITIEFVKTHLYVTITSILSVFIAIFLMFLLEYRCPSCKNYWVYRFIDSDVVDIDDDPRVIAFWILRFVYNNEVHLDEHQCDHCGYSCAKKIKKRSIELR